MAAIDSMDQTLGFFMNYAEMMVDLVMRSAGQAKAVEAMQGAIDMNVYDAYPESKYDRKKTEGGLTDPKNIETHWENQTKTLTVESTRTDWEPVPKDGRHEGRLVAPVVESGRGFDWWKNPRPRNFTKLTDQILEVEIDKLLTEQAELALGGWQM